MPLPARKQSLTGSLSFPEALLTELKALPRSKYFSPYKSGLKTSLQRDGGLTCATAGSEGSTVVTAPVGSAGSRTRTR